MKKLLIVMVCFFLAGCVVNRETMMRANYGSRPTYSEAIDRTKNYFEKQERIVIDQSILKACDYQPQDLETELISKFMNDIEQNQLIVEDAPLLHQGQKVLVQLIYFLPAII